MGWLGLAHCSISVVPRLAIKPYHKQLRSHSRVKAPHGLNKRTFENTYRLFVSKAFNKAVCFLLLLYQL